MTNTNSINSFSSRLEQPQERKMPYEIRQQLLAAGATEEQLAAAGTPEKDQALAAELGITLTMPTPPSKTDSTDSTSNESIFTQESKMPYEIRQQLLAAGATEEQLSAAGTPEKDQALATELGITLTMPTPPSGTGLFD